MTVYYVDPEGSQGTGDGSSFANRAEKIQAIKDNHSITGGDEIRIKASTAPTSLGTGKVTKYPIDRNYNGRTFTLNTLSTGPGSTTWTLNDHGLNTGDVVWVYYYGGSNHTTTGAGRPNGEYNVTVSDDDTFQLNGFVGVSGTSYSGMRLVNVTQAQIYLNTNGITKFVYGGNDCDNLSNERTAWDVNGSGVSSSLKFGWSAWSSASMKQMKPPYSDEIVIGSTLVTGKVAYKRLKQTLDLSNFQQLNFHCQQISGTKLEGNLSIRLCTDMAGNNSVATFPIDWGHNNSFNPTSSYMWLPMVIDKGSAIGSGINSIALYVDTHVGAQTVRFSDFFVSKAPTATDCLTLKSLVGLDTTADPLWWSVGNVYNNRLMLSIGSPMRGRFGQSYYGSAGVYFSAANTSAPIKVVQPITTNYTRTNGSSVSSNWNLNMTDLSSSWNGTSGNQIVISGGWNRTDMSTQGTGSAGWTFLDGQTQQGTWLDAGSARYITIEKLWGVRYYNFIKLDDNSSGGREVDIGFTQLYNNGISGRYNKLKVKWAQNDRYPYIQLRGQDTGFSPSDFSFIGHGGGGVQTANVYFASQTSAIHLGEVSMYAYGDKSIYITNCANLTIDTLNFGYNNGYQNGHDCYLSESSNLTFGTVNAYGGVYALSLQKSDVSVNTLNHTDWTNHRAHGYLNSSKKAFYASNCTTPSSILGGTVDGTINSTNGSKIRLYNLVINASEEVDVSHEGGSIESAKHDGVAGVVLTQFYRNKIEKETSTVQASGGVAWKQTITADSLASNPKAFDVAKVAVNGGSQVTLSVYCYRNSTNTYGGIHIKPNALIGITSAVRGYTSGSTGAWEQISITCTPNAAGILEVQLGGYRSSGDGIIYYDTFSASQA